MPARILNTSLPFNGPTANRTLDSPLSFWREWRLRVRCGNPDCASHSLRPVAELLPRHGGLTVREVARRLRCSHCGQTSARLAFVGRAEGRRRVHPVRGEAWPAPRPRPAAASPAVARTVG